MNIIITLIVFAVLLYLWYIYIFSYLKKQHLKTISDNMKIVQIKIPMKTSDGDTKTDNIQNMKSNIEVMNQVFKNLTSMIKEDRKHNNLWQEYISLEMVVEKEAIKYILAVPSDHLESVEKNISWFFPGSLVDYISPPKILETGKYMAGGHFLLTKASNLPIKTYETFELDPMDSILSAYSRIWYEEKFVFQIMIRPVSEKETSSFRSKSDKIKEGKSEEWFISSLFKSLKDINKTEKDATKDEPKKNKFTSWQQWDIEKKTENELFVSNIRVLATSPDRNRPDVIIKDFERTLYQYNYVWLNSFKYKKSQNIYLLSQNIASRNRQNNDLGFIDKKDSRTCILSIKELSSIYHFPHSRFNRNPRIRRQKFKIVPAPENLPDEGIVLWYNLYGGVKKQIKLAPMDRFRHFYCIWQTGTGKTTMLLTMAKHDLIHNNGFCFIDPHGDFCEKLLEFYPKDRINDLIYFNVADTNNPIGFNVLEAETDEERDVIVSDLIEMFVGMYGAEIFGPRIQDYFRNACYLLMEQPEGGTIAEVVRLFTDPAFCKAKQANLKNPITRARREKTYNSMWDREKQEIIPYLQAKFSPFTDSGIVRNIVWQPKSSFNMWEIMQQNKILLVNLSKGLIGEENSKLIGNFISTQIKVAALRRANMFEHERVPFFLYIDEFQNYVNKSIESILSEARKYRLWLAVAHQYIDQLKQRWLGWEINLGDAIFGNVWSIMSYKVWAKDAEFLEKEFAPEIGQSDLVNMDTRMGVMKLSVDTQPSRPFTMYANNPYEPAYNPPEKVVIMKQIAALKRGRKKDLVEKEIFFRVGV